jgi:hypothetical protein
VFEEVVELAVYVPTDRDRNGSFKDIPFGIKELREFVKENFHIDFIKTVTILDHG